MEPFDNNRPRPDFRKSTADDLGFDNNTATFGSTFGNSDSKYPSDDEVNSQPFELLSEANETRDNAGDNAGDNADDNTGDDAGANADNDTSDDAGDDGYDDAGDDGLSRRANAGVDRRTQDIINFLSRVLFEMGMDVSVRHRKPRPGLLGPAHPDEIHLEIVGYDVGRVIGKKGQVLSALQNIVNRAANRPGLDRKHVLLDAEGYRQRRESTLANLARRLGEQAVQEGKIVTFEPMSPRDRRIVHLALAKVPNVVTKSDGEGDDRRVRIIPVRR